MPVSSAYSLFEVKHLDRNTGIAELLPEQTVYVYDMTNEVALDDLVSDGHGHVEAGTLPLDVGTSNRFSYLRANRFCGMAEIVTQ